MELYSYFRSSAAYRVRITLNIKQLDYEVRPVSLLNNEQHADSYSNINPQGLVPALVTDDGQVLTQSLAICEYLDEVYPQPPLLPQDATGRARVRSLANIIACDIHPLNNLRVLNHLSGKFDISGDERTDWYHHWIATGLRALESALGSGDHSGRYCHGDQLTLADIALVPQWYNAIRFKCALEDYPIIGRIVANCERLDAFAQAHPDRQSDAS